MSENMPTKSDAELEHELRGEALRASKKLVEAIGEKSLGDGSKLVQDINAAREQADVYNNVIDRGVSLARNGKLTRTEINKVFSSDTITGIKDESNGDRYVYTGDFDGILGAGALDGLDRDATEAGRSYHEEQWKQSDEFKDIVGDTEEYYRLEDERNKLEEKMRSLNQQITAKLDKAPTEIDHDTSEFSHLDDNAKADWLAQNKMHTVNSSARKNLSIPQANWQTRLRGPSAEQH